MFLCNYVTNLTTQVHSTYMTYILTHHETMQVDVYQISAELDLTILVVSTALAYACRNLGEA